MIAHLRCMSATEVYRATQTTDFIEPMSEEPMGDVPAEQGSSTHRTSKKPGDKSNSGPATGAKSDQGQYRTH